ncbi:molybdopterin cofactor-binding domain-containing protein [Qipengyuania sp. JC766]|uniref:molybdopterin cofactor-binding domain-containing protein n=1 Tax=Qipengyuania sp. JC766 TaxID=3232139 RepID=UPI0034596320
MKVSRRGILVGAAVGGGLLVAWTLRPRSFPTPLEPAEGEYAFDAWLKIAEDGVVTVAVPQLEMGQGVTTILPQIVAQELGADWRQVAVEPAPVSGAYANVPLAARWAALWMPFAPSLAESETDIATTRFAQMSRFTATADGSTISAYEIPSRNAAASARAVLAMEAAERWDVRWEECEVADGLVRHGERSATFAQLVAGASEREPPDPPPLRPEPMSERPMPGEVEGAGAFPRLDLPSKVDGSHVFAGDVRLPDMVFAAIRHGPLDRAELTAFNPSAGDGNPRVLGHVDGKAWLAVVASDWWTADRTVDAMTPRFRVTAPVDSDTIEQRLGDAVRDGPSARLRRIGPDNSVLDDPDFARRYDIEPAIHAAIETATATARLTDGRLELWLASQAPERTRVAAAEALGLSEEDVVLYPMPAGGSFDSRLDDRHAVEAAIIAREIGRPVQLVWSRWQEHLAGFPRAPAAATLAARFVPNQRGRIAVLRTRIAVPATARELGGRLFDGKPHWEARKDVAEEADPLAVEGAWPPYDIPDMALNHAPLDIGLSTGPMRGGAHGYTAFMVESFVDEVAAEFGREPLSYRIEMLGEDTRLVQCLQEAARLARWNGGLSQSGQGIACHRMQRFGATGRIACVATARRGEGGIQVTRLSAAVDLGRIVNLDIARQQIEGGLVFGMAQALGASTTYRDGLPQAQRLADLNLPTLADCPEIEVEFLPGESEPFDPGELGVAVAAPAIANALYSATGLRFRRLPLISGGL